VSDGPSSFGRALAAIVGSDPYRLQHNGPELILVTPWREHFTFTFGSSVGSGDLHDIRHTKPTQLANLHCSRILVWEPPADEFLAFYTRRVLKNRNSFRDAAENEIRRFEHSGTAGIRRYDNDIGRRDRFIDDERPSCGSQNGLPKGRDSNDHSSGQCNHHHQDQDPP
jgi:hypothetical protein